MERNKLAVWTLGISIALGIYLASKTIQIRTEPLMIIIIVGFLSIIIGTRIANRNRT